MSILDGSLKRRDPEGIPKLRRQDPPGSARRCTYSRKPWKMSLSKLRRPPANQLPATIAPPTPAFQSPGEVRRFGPEPQSAAGLRPQAEAARSSGADRDRGLGRLAAAGQPFEGGEPLLERLHADRELLVLLAGGDHHVAKHVELLLLGDLHLLQKALDLALEDGLDLAADALGGAGGVGHQPGNVVEEAVRGRGHGCRSG